MAQEEQILRHEIAAIEFGFYTSDEIRKLSVKQITSRLAFDGLENPIVNGLYDPALGPMDYNQICPNKPCRAN